MTTPTNEPAFPTTRANADDGVGDRAAFPGMTLRDYFAAAALTGLIARTKTEGSRSDFARWSYEYADAMLAARGGAS